MHAAPRTTICKRPEPRDKVTQTRRDMAAAGQSKGVGMRHWHSHSLPVSRPLAGEIICGVIF